MPGDARRVLLCLLLALQAVPCATADEDSSSIERPVEPAPFAIESAYFEIILAWAHGSETAVAELSDLQQRLAEHQAGFAIDLASLSRLATRPRTRRRSTSTNRALPSLDCMRKIQHFVEARIAGHEPEAILPLADLNRRLYRQQMGRETFRLWLAEHSEARAFRLIDVYLEVAEPREAAQRQAAGVLIAMADALAGVGLEAAEAKARKVFARVLQLDPDNFAARYWAAFLAERAGRYEDAVGHLVALEESSPDDVEVALRLAINRLRTGGQEVAVAALEEIAGDDGADSGALFRLPPSGGTDWLRILAYQQLGRLDAGPRPRRAVAALREGVRRFPDNARLRLQLSYLTRDDWSTALAEVRQVENDWRGDAGASPRVRYCRPRRDEIDVELARLEQAVEERKAALARGLEQVLEDPRWRRLRFDQCPSGMPPE